MAKFIATIQLLDADEKDYNTLQRELENQAFRGEMPIAHSQAYINGKAVFSREGNVTLQDVNRAVFKAADKTGRKYSFFVVKHKPVANMNYYSVNSEKVY
ncbi:MAG: hypothetical protein ABIS01_07810 [Ferruginibacter sp.]